MTNVTFNIALQSMAALPVVSANLSRMGAKITYMLARDNQMHISLSVAENAVHMFAPQLRRIVEVLEVVEVAADNDVVQTPDDFDVCVNSPQEMLCVAE